jgi:hypothetical protein
MITLTKRYLFNDNSDKRIAVGISKVLNVTAYQVLRYLFDLHLVIIEFKTIYDNSES